MTVAVVTIMPVLPALWDLCASPWAEHSQSREVIMPILQMGKQAQKDKVACPTSPGDSGTKVGFPPTPI